MINTYEEMEEYLNDIPKISKKTSPENIKAALAALGNPHKNQKFIHVAGTNGKGSVCSFCAQVLMDNGIRTAMFTSPHLIRLNERFKFNGEDASDAAMLACFHDVLALFDGSHPELVHASYFEFLFLMGMLLFSREKAEVTVLEVGLGGLNDVTNVIEEPMVSIIASISHDHTEILGDTIEDIAAHKAGIIKNRVPVIYDAGDFSAAEVIAKIAKEKNAPAYPVGYDDLTLTEVNHEAVAYRVNRGILAGEEYRVTSPAVYQAMNSCLAVTALRVAFPNLFGVRESIAKAHWMGRMDRVLPGVYLDGGHNDDGIRRFLETEHRLTCRGKKILLFSVVIEKNVEKMVGELCGSGDFDVIILAQMNSYRAYPAEQLCEIFHRFTNVPIDCFPTTEEALTAALKVKEADDLLFIAGSLYLAGEVLESLKKEIKNDQF